MTILILVLKVYSVNEVSVIACRIQKNPWSIGNRCYMRYLQGECACITYKLRWIGDEVCDPLKYDGQTTVDIFVK